MKHSMYIIFKAMTFFIFIALLQACEASSTCIKGGEYSTVSIYKITNDSLVLKKELHQKYNFGNKDTIDAELSKLQLQYPEDLYRITQKDTTIKLSRITTDDCRRTLMDHVCECNK